LPVVLFAPLLAFTSSLASTPDFLASLTGTWIVSDDKSLPNGVACPSGAHGAETKTTLHILVDDGSADRHLTAKWPPVNIGGPFRGVMEKRLGRDAPENADEDGVVLADGVVAARRRLGPKGLHPFMGVIDPFDGEIWLVTEPTPGYNAETWHGRLLSDNLLKMWKVREAQVVREGLAVSLSYWMKVANTPGEDIPAYQDFNKQYNRTYRAGGLAGSVLEKEGPTLK